MYIHITCSVRQCYRLWGKKDGVPNYRTSQQTLLTPSEFSQLPGLGLEAFRNNRTKLTLVLVTREVVYQFVFHTPVFVSQAPTS